MGLEPGYSDIAGLDPTIDELGSLRSNEELLSRSPRRVLIRRTRRTAEGEVPRS